MSQPESSSVDQEIDYEKKRREYFGDIDLNDDEALERKLIEIDQARDTEKFKAVFGDVRNNFMDLDESEFNEAEKLYRRIMERIISMIFSNKLFKWEVFIDESIKNLMKSLIKNSGNDS